MCTGFEKTGVCTFPHQCKYEHSWEPYFKVKPSDIHYEGSAKFSDEPPFVASGSPQVGGENDIGKTVDFATECPVFKDLGYCTFGWRCRFLGGHVRRAEGEGADSATRIGGWELLGLPDASDEGNREGKNDEVNWPKQDVVTSLRKNKVG